MEESVQEKFDGVQLADEYTKRHASQKKRGFEDVRILEKGVLPKWGLIPAKEIGRRDVVRCLIRS